MDIRRPTTARDGPESKGLTARQQKALGALMTCPTVQEAAERAQVGYRTLKRWLAEDETFKAAYQKEMSANLADAVRQSRHGLTGALTTLSTIAQDKTAPAAARVSAARAVVELSAKLAETADFDARLAALEAAEKARNN